MAFKRILFRRDTAANWTSVNPTLSNGEVGYETDTGKIKIGNGSSVWSSLQYFVGHLAGGSLDSLGDVTIVDAQTGDFLRWNGSAWINDPVNLSTDTIGDYVESLVPGTGVYITGSGGEGSTPSIAIGQDVSASSSPTFESITLGSAPALDMNAATKAYVDGVAAGIKWRNSAELATAAVLPNQPDYANGTSGVGATLTATTNGRLVVDGANASNGNRVLVKNQSNAAHNGIYDVTSQGSVSTTWVLTRSSDFDGLIDKVTRGNALYVMGGSTNIAQGFVVTSEGNLTAGAHEIGVDEITFTQFTGTSAIAVGTGITKTGNIISIGQDVATSASVTFAAVSAPLIGNASTATTLRDPRLIAGNTFDGSSDIDIEIEDLSGLTITTTEANSLSGITSNIQSQLNNKASASVSPTITLSGDLSGEVTLVSLGNATLNATINSNSVALGTDTTGNYMQDVSPGTGITIAHTPGEGSTATISVTANTYDAYGLSASVQANVLNQLDTHANDTTNIHGITDTANLVTKDGVQTLTNKTLTSPTITGISPVITLGGDLSGSLTLTNLAGGTLNATVNANSVALGTDTTGDYVASLQQGTGIYITNNSGEGTSPTIAIGQDVSASSTPSFAQLSITNLPTTSTHVATKEYVDEVAQGLQAKPAVRAATTENLDGTYDNGTLGVGATLTADSNGELPAIDGVSGWSQYDGILLKDQTDKAENGRWVVWVVGDSETPWQLRRCGLCDEKSEIPGAYIFVFDGVVNVNNGYVLSVDDSATFTVGTDDINVIQFSGAGQVIAGTGVIKDGNIISIGQDVSSSVTATFAGLNVTGTSILMNSDETSSPSQDVSFVVERGSSNNVSIKWNESTDKWEVTEDGAVYSEVVTESRLDQLEIGELSNVDLSTPASNGQFLKYDSSASVWVADSIPTINSLDDIGDVDAETPTVGDVLQWDGSSWVSASASGGGASVSISTSPPGSPEEGAIWFESDTLKTYIYYDSFWIEVAGSPPPASLSDLGDVSIASPSNGNILQYNGTQWVLATIQAAPSAEDDQIILSNRIFR